MSKKERIEVVDGNEVSEEVVATDVVLEKKGKKLAKTIEGNIVTIVEGATGTVLTYDFSTLPADIQTKFGPFGLGHKLGDAAAGVSGVDAVNSINKVWEGLSKGDWSVRAPKGETISKNDLFSKVEAIEDPEKREEMRLLLQSLMSKR